MSSAWPNAIDDDDDDRKPLCTLASSHPSIELMIWFLFFVSFSILVTSPPPPSPPPSLLSAKHFPTLQQGLPDVWVPLVNPCRIQGETVQLLTTLFDTPGSSCDWPVVKRGLFLFLNSEIHSRQTVRQLRCEIHNKTFNKS